MNNKKILKKIEGLRRYIWEWNCSDWDCEQCPLNLSRNNCLCDKLKNMIDKRLEKFKPKICSKCGQEIKEEKKK